ncbi:PGF-pre-PGF domain-containing protein [Candidatus Woesearchaeota archaeon]|nr:PGF-pre-PGF domain-containing protein [Candidatus Woesearchaeota archaeon]
MEHKGNVWVIIFFLIIAFVLLNTFSLPASTPLSVDIKRGDNLVDADITEAHPLPGEAPPGKLYRSFTLATDYEGATMTFDISKEWLRQERVHEQAITLHRWDGEGWAAVNTTIKVSYTTETVYDAGEAMTGTYAITGEQGTADDLRSDLPSVQAQLGILILVIIVLLFIAYHRSGERRQPKQGTPDLQRLQAYINQSLLAGHGDNDIRERLISAGWDEKLVDQGLRRARFF